MEEVGRAVEVEEFALVVEAQMLLRKVAHALRVAAVERSGDLRVGADGVATKTLAEVTQIECNVLSFDSCGVWLLRRRTWDDAWR